MRLRGVVINAKGERIDLVNTPVDRVADLRSGAKLEHVSALFQGAERHRSLYRARQSSVIATRVRWRSLNLGDRNPVAAVDAKLLIRRAGMPAPEFQRHLRPLSVFQVPHIQVALAMADGTSKQGFRVLT